ncbi:zinc metalloprotease [Actinocrispum wychmicini]|uniref:Pregnancy-associated plasma protein-A n=1 Tax=Actinocrispum wychmicini TaxID=1213861 RepID=A0A4R2JXR6_9PSEU|nr:zinc metalloprotease [Actinocrispum wychmicini]TCO62156.1 pregnancy-associated plasma protein-A [Actinocrispum wychmicini]
MRVFGALLTLALASGMVVTPGAAAETSPAATAKTDCAQARLVDDPGHDPDNPPESEVVEEQTAEERILQELFDQHQLPQGMLVEGQDGKIHANLATGQVKIPVYVHVVSTGDTGKITDDTVRKQIAVLNNNFGAATGFAFVLRGTDRTDNQNWFQAVTASPAEKAMKTKLHKGRAGDLNLYFNNPGYKAPGDGKLLGIATWPKDYASSAALDGVVVKYNTVPGGAFKPYDQGKTATHEVGHWLGLYHTFQGGCEAPGDEVDDTPYEAEPAAGCPQGQDSCPAPGTDPVHNYMDYSDDSCMTTFSPGQAQRAADHWAAYRQPRSA